MALFGLIKDRAPCGQITRDRRIVRGTDELIGLCRGVLADGHVSTQEAQFVLDWIDRNAEFTDAYPYNILVERLHNALADGVVDADEERDLLDTLVRFVGGEASGEYGSESASRSTTLPFDTPYPSPLNWTSRFVVTGTFKFGARSNVNAEIERMGGLIANAVSKKVGYLVVGEIGSRDWIHSNYGRKIEYAVDLRSQGVPIAIIGEEHWATCLHRS